jgi:hypothetical protein
MIGSVASKPLSSSIEAIGASDRRRLLPLALLVAAVSAVVVTAALTTWLNRDWTQATAAAGVGATVVAAAVLLGSAQGWSNGARTSLAAISTGIIGIGALALVVLTYAGGAGNIGISHASSHGGTTSAAANTEGIALQQQKSNNDLVPPGYSHDLGAHPTFDQFIAMDEATVLANVPGGTLTPDEVPVLRTQLQAARDIALKYNTVDKAIAAGYFNTTNDVPFMGAHFINSRYLGDGVFDPAKPEGLLFSKLGNPNGAWNLVGVWYLILPGQGGSSLTVPPQGFAGNLDLWHQHYGLCTRAGIISENNSEESCAADHGSYIGDLRWMMHTWVYPENADNSQGVFSYLNNDLYMKQQGAFAGGSQDFANNRGRLRDQ